MNNSPHAQFYLLLGQLPHASKEDIVAQYSSTATTSLRVLYEQQPAQYRRMVADMKRTVDDLRGENGALKAANAALEGRAELKRLRSAILLRLQKYGVDTADWSAVNAFMRQPRIAGKTLGEMDAAELRGFIPKIESILTKKHGLS